MELRVVTTVFRTAQEKIIEVLKSVPMVLLVWMGIWGWVMPAEGAQPDYSRLQAELKAALQGATGTYGLCLIDLESGSEFGLNEREVFHAASTFKVPLNFYLATKVAAGEVNPDRYLEYKEEHFEGGTGHLQFQQFGTRYKIAQLARDSIVTSDNVATNMLLGYLGHSNVKNFMRSLGAEVVDHKQNTTCPRDMALIIRALVRFADEHPAAGGTVLQHMRNSVFREGIPAAVPAGIPVANKIGYWPATGTYNDVAYVQHPTRPYILTIYSKGTPGHAAAFAQVRRLTSIVHAFQESAALRIDLQWDDRTPVLLDPPILRAGRAEVPVRALVNALPELGLTWDAAKGELTVFSRATEKQASFRPGEDSYRIYNGRAYLPLRTLAESLGYQVEWDGQNMKAAVVNPERSPAAE